MYGMRRNELRVVPHDPTWKDDFAAEKDRILHSLGDGKVQIEHVGSTAIETVYAKPVLDIAILCDEDGFATLVELWTNLVEYRGSTKTNPIIITPFGLWPIRIANAIYTQATAMGIEAEIGECAETIRFGERVHRLQAFCLNL